MRGRTLLIVFSLFFSFTVKGDTTVPDQSVSKSTQTQKKKLYQGLSFPKETPEEAAAWKKIEDILHPGTQVDVWKPLTPAEIRQRDRDMVRRLQEAQMAAQVLGIVQSTRWMEGLAKESDRKMKAFEKDWDENIRKPTKKSLEEYQQHVARMPQETEAWRQSMREDTARWKEKMDAEREAKRVERQEAWAKTKARWEQGSAASHVEKDKGRTEPTEENTPVSEKIDSLESASSVPALSPTVSTDSETATLTVQYKILPNASLEIVGDHNLSFSDVWNDPRPQKTVTVRVKTNATQVTTLSGYFLGSSGLSHVSKRDKMVRCSVTMDNRDIPLSATPVELLSVGHVPEEGNVPLILTLEKQENMPAGTYTATLVFEVAAQ